MSSDLDFDGHCHRCLFQNDCVQAHLIGLRPDCPRFHACVSTAVTLLLTFGEVQIEMNGSRRLLHAGDHVEVFPRTALRIQSSTEADVMLLVRHTAA